MKVKNKKAQTGINTAIIAGVIALIVTVIVGFVIIQTLNEAKLFGTETTVAMNSGNESDTTGAVAFVNLTTYTVQNENSSTKAFVLTNIWASTDPRHSATAVAAAGGWGYNYSIGLGNASIGTGNGIVTNVSDFNQTILSNVTLVYTYVFVTSGIADKGAVINNLTANLSEGVGDVGEKIPTILKIAIVIVLLGVLFLLIVQVKRMGLFDGGSGGL